MNINDAFNAVKILSPDEAELYFQNNPIESYTLLDVRQPKEYEEAHIPGAVLIPLPELPDRVSELSTDLPIISYCRSGQRSYSAASFLKGVGFQEVYSMSGGINAWEGLEAQGAYDAGLFLLQDATTLEELVTIGWALEDGTGRFYKEVEGLIDKADKAVVGLFSQLATAESRHKETLMSAYNKITGGETRLREDILEKHKDLMESGTSISNAIAAIKRAKNPAINILELAMQIEINSLDLYSKILKGSQDKAVIELMGQIIEEEKGHLRRLGEAIEGLKL